VLTVKSICVLHELSYAALIAAMSNKDKHPPVLDRLARSRGEEIRLAREELGWSQADLAERAGTTQQTVDRVERGVTAHSRAYPNIRAAVGLTPVPGIEGSIYTRIEGEKDKRDLRSRHQKISLLGAKSAALAENVIPVMSGTNMIDVIPKGYPVTFAENSFAALIPDDLMSPVFRAGDIVVINPHLPIQSNTEIMAAKMDEDGTVVTVFRTLIHETKDSYLVKSLNPEKEEELLKSEFTEARQIVAKYNRYR